MSLSWNEAFNRKTPEPAAGNIIPIRPAADGTTPYAAKALAEETQAVRMATEGNRNDQLNRAAFALSQLVAAGHLGYQQVRDELLDAARTVGLPAAEAEKTIGSGFRSGTLQPRQVEIRADSEGPSPDVIEVDPATFAPHQEDGDEPEAPARTSWWAEPIDDLIANTSAMPAPDVLVRSDGRGVFYRGKVNGLLGESESGKSWVALHAGHQEAASGGRLLIIDFEDTPHTAMERLRALGCPAEAFARIRYANPDQALDVLASADLSEILAEFDPTLVIVDGVNAAMTLLGLDLNSNTDATVFYTRLLRPLTTRGASVITVDHVPKNPEQRGKGGIGAQAKRAMISGCALRVEVAEPFGRGQSGKLKLYVDKDRPGHVRGYSGSGKYAGSFLIESSGDIVRAEIEAPDLTGANTWKPTGVMASISRLLQAQPLSKNAIENMIDGRRETIREALRHLVADGFVRVESGTRGAILHHSVKPFSVAVEEVTTDEL